MSGGFSSEKKASNEQRVRELLRHTWHAFFGRFGRLTEAQAQVAEPIARGESVVLCAPTASGKTEALLAPMIDRGFSARTNSQAESRTGLQLLVVCPTRALCNDFLRRVRRPVEACSWVVELKTGDDPSFSADNPPDMLVTTPESLDSILSRQPAALRGLEGIFLDEIHLLDGSPRGDHLLALVWRLKSFRPDLQVCCASATAADAGRLSREWCGDGARVVRIEGGRDRELQASFEHIIDPFEAARALEGLVSDEPGAKTLVFANTRNEVEWLSATLAKSLGASRVFAHHGSLAKAERLRAEKGFLNASSGVCVATMTLELGIDIGDVDRVVLVNPAPNVASFTQRVGRSNRRGGAIRVVCLYSSKFDRLRFEHQIACARAGKLFVEPQVFRPTILPQQAVSLIFQNPKGWVSAGALHGRLPPSAQEIWTRADCQDVLEVMRAEGYLHADSRGRFVADKLAKKDWRYGRIHAHIGGDAEVEVVDETTGRTIGTAHWSGDDQSRAEGDVDGLLLGGKQRKVTRVRDRRVFVEAADLDEAPSFLSRMGPNYSFALARDLAAFADLGDDTLWLTRTGGHISRKNEWRLEHYFGTLWGRLLAPVLRSHGFGFRGGMGAFHAKVSRRPRRLADSLGTPAAIESTVDDYLKTGYKQLEKRLQPGPWKRFVPPDMMRRWVRACVRPEEFAQVAAGFRVCEA